MHLVNQEQLAKFQSSLKTSVFLTLGATLKLIPSKQNMLNSKYIIYAA